MSGNITLTHFLRSFIPEPQNRIDVSLDALPKMLVANAAAMISLVTLAYCAHTSASRLLRLSILPLVVLLTAHTSFGYRWPHETQNVINWAQGMNVFFFLGKAVDFAIAPKGAFVSADSSGKSANPFWDSVKSIGALRDPTRGLFQSPQIKSMLPGEFVRKTILRMAVNFAIFDVAETIQKMFPGIGSFDGGIFYPGLSLPLRLLTSTFITLVLGLSALAMIEMSYDVAALVSVGVFGQSPATWPPIFNSPWKATSLQDLWGRRWHQMLRRTSTLLGGTPGYWIGGRAGFVIGTFIITGLVHEIPMYCTGYPFEWAPLLFFILQGFLVIGEKEYERITGKKVGGWSGRLWTYFAMIGLGQPLVDSWLRRCLGNAAVLPPSASPTKLLLRALTAASAATS